MMANVELEKATQFKLYQWHKSSGVLLLLAFILRLVLRLLIRPPALPEVLSGAQQRMTKIGHWAMYGLMLAMPLTGWLMVSASVYGLPTIVFNWFEWPHIPNVQGEKHIEERANTAHFVLAILFFSAIVGHIGAVIWHRKYDGIRLIKRMWWS